MSTHSITRTLKSGRRFDFHTGRPRAPRQAPEGVVGRGATPGRGLRRLARRVGRHALRRRVDVFMGAGAERRRRRRRRRHGRGGRRAARRDRGVFRRAGERRRADPPRRRAQARAEARGGAHGRARAPRQRAPGRRRRREGELLGAALRARRRRAAEARGRRDLRVAAIEGREQRPLLLDDGARGPRDLWGLRVRAGRRTGRRPHRRRGLDGRRLSGRAAPTSPSGPSRRRSSRR